MGLFDSFFSPTKQTSTSTVDPYANMPDWLKSYFQEDVSRTGDMLDEGDRIAQGLANNPTQLSGLSQQELNANRNIQQAGRQGTNNIGRGLDAINPQYHQSSNMMDKAGRGVGQTFNAAQQQLAQAGDFEGDWNQYEDMLTGSADYGRFREDYMNPYTDSVVDTTMAGMRHNAGVEQARRGASEAAVGGISSTRAAVADATAEALNNMNMAQMEATLRSEGFDTASQLGLAQQAQQLGIANAGFNEQLNESQLGMDLADAGMGLQDDYSRLMADLASRGYDLSSRYLADQSQAAKDRMGLTETASTWGATTGAGQRGIRDANREARRTADRDALTWNSGLFNSTRNVQAPVGSTQTSTTPGPSPFNQLAGTAISAAGMWAGL